MKFRMPRLVCCWLCAWIAIGLQSAAAVKGADAVWSVETFNSRKADWEQLVGAPIRIEGRISVPGRSQFKLAKCDLTFIISDSPVRSSAIRGNVELSGRIKRDKENGKLIFDVDKIESVPSDADQFESRSAKLRNPRAEDWYALGDWALERSRFYDDAELAGKATSAYERGVNMVWRSLAEDDAKGRFELAAKITRLNLPDAKRMELMHEGYRILFQTVLKNKPKDADAWKQLASQMDNDLDGCKQQLTKLPEILKDRYEREPLAAYREASSADRLQLHRLLYITAILKPILMEAEPDGRNGDAIADRIELLSPESKAIAEQYRHQKLNWRLNRAATATCGEIEQLASELRSRQQPELARQAVQKWLQAREPRLREDGPLGLLQLADEYQKLAGDESKAAAILIEAHKLDPTFKDVSQKLQSLGYGQVGGTWIKGASSEPAVATPPVVQGGAAGGISVGMTASQLVVAMSGRPGSVTRVYTKNGVSEVWSYLPVGTSRLIIRLERSNTSAEPVVIDYRTEH